MLAVECVLALHDTDMRLLTHGERSLTQGIGHIKVGNGRILERRIFLRRVLKADGSRRNDDIAGLNLQVDAAAGTDADERVRTDVVQLLHGDGSGRAADAGGADADLLAEERTGVDIILTILGNMHRIVEQLCDGLAAARIAGQQAIAANIAFDTMDMELLIKLLHGEKLPSFFGSTTQRCCNLVVSC